MKKYILLFLIFTLITLSFISCLSLQKDVKTSWVERLKFQQKYENDILYSICAFVDKEAMNKYIIFEGYNPFIYKDPLITKQESALFSLLIVPKVNFYINADEISVKTEEAQYPVLFKEFTLNQNLYETEDNSATKKMKSFVQKYFISKKESYRAGERKVRFLYAILNYDYKGAVVRIPIHTENNKISVLNFIFPEIKR